MSGKKLSAKIVAEASKIAAATMHEAAGKVGALPAAIKPVTDGVRICGRAFPVKGKGGDNVWLHRALAKAGKGDILVADVSGVYEYGYWGDVMTTAARARGIAGLVINGCVRDKLEIIESGFPLFCRGFAIRGTGKDFEGPGFINQPLDIEGVTVNPGDLILGDDDGVICMPAARVAEVIKKSHAREKKEQETMAQLRSGKTTMQIYGWK
jgi:4-hydroxy-4-methyl-2-oxoglutarate aldolase